LPQSPLQETEKQTPNGALHDQEKLDTQISKTQNLKLDVISDIHFKTLAFHMQKNRSFYTVSKSWRQQRSQQSTTTATITRVPNK
jgi:bifunctional pyridoxal-dependent enzyme with beta-cystathionase and maltose regulon repressor activities